MHLPPQLNLRTTTVTMYLLIIGDPDVKKTIASHLYHRLSSGLRVFFDKTEMQAGDPLTNQLKGAIRSASVHIAIFSPKYAESKWCLDELLLMLESLESGATIIPVFYHVNPHDLRWAAEGGAYAEALLNHKEKKTKDPETGKEKPRHDSNTIDNWIKALHRVADISGLNLEDCNGDEGELVTKVVERVQRKVRRTPLNVATYPTGLREKLEDLDKTVLLRQHSSKAQVVGIVGLGGIGKTTLAKEFFNTRRRNYDAACFLFDVREAASKGSLPSLQNQLLKDLMGQEVHSIQSIDEGICILKSKLQDSSTRALIILDDVDHVRQLEALFLHVKDVLGPGNLILVTSRDKGLLTGSGIAESSIYSLTGLDIKYSQELFCRHAFQQPHPHEGFEELVTKFLHACNGLPMSLKVIGALLHGKEDLKDWEAQLRKISKVLPSDIQSVLKISYDSLDEEQKDIFLDIACFFVGEDRDTVIRIWEGSDWEGSLGVVEVQNKCLVEVDSENRIRMHDQVRDLGRYMAEKSPPDLPRRLWRPIDNLTLQNVPNQSSVRGVGMFQRNSENSVPPNRSVVDLSRLQLLRAEGDCLESIFIGPGQSPDLIWLCWYNCPYSFLPSWLPINKLRVLQVTGGEILETLWETENQAPLQLRELNVNVRLSQLPQSIGQLKHLEKIEIKEGSMVFLPNSFGNLTNLQYLDLSWSSNLQELPHSFGNLIRLKHLCLTGCSELSISEGTLGNITSLVSLDLSFCLKLDVLPSQLAWQRSLENLNLLGTSLSRVLESDIGGLDRLKTLKLGSPSLEMLPPSLGNLSSLKELTLSECSGLAYLPDSVGGLRSLNEFSLSGCWNLESLPESVGELTSLKELSLSQCTSLKCLPDSMGKLTSLKQLALSFCYSLECLPDSMGKLTSLKQLILSSCNRLRCLPDSVGELKQLTKMEIGFSQIRYLPICVMEMHNLENLNIRFTPLLSVPFAKKVLTRTEISTEIVSGNNKLMGGLKYLELSKTNISNICFLEGICPNLQHLKIDCCNDLVEVGALPTSLITLEILLCDSLRKIEGLCGLAKLRQLDISGCKQVKELSSLETLTSLEELRAFKCKKLKRIRGLAQLAKLWLIDVEACYEIKELEGIQDLRSLTEYGDSRCSKLQDGLGVLKRLRVQVKKPPRKKLQHIRVKFKLCKFIIRDQI